MALSRLGYYIEKIERPNLDLQYGIESVRGVSNTKQIQKTKANLDGRTFEKFQILHRYEYVFNRRTTRNGERIGLGFNNSDQIYIFTEDYVLFRIKKSKLKELHPIYLYIFFNRDEFDRIVRYNSWGSATEFFNWDDMCDIEIVVPSMEVQQKVVNVYLAMVANQKVYEKGLDDLKLTCDAYIENIREKQESHKLVDFLEETKEINTEKTVLFERGLNKFKGFVKPSAMSNNVDLSKRKVVRFNHFVYPSPHFGEQGTIGLFKEEACIMSQMYTTFRVIDNRLNPDYLYLWFKRNEFMRYAFFAASDSVRDTFDFTKLCDYKIPVPSQTIQKNIVEVYEAYEMRKKINENLKEQINDICPVLIKGSIDLNH